MLYSKLLVALAVPFIAALPLQLVLGRDLAYLPLFVISPEDLHTVLLGACDSLCVTDSQTINLCFALSLGCNC